MKQNYFEINNLSKEFKNKSGVKNVNFYLNKGDIVGFLGDNGTGKTTTIKLIFNEYIRQSGEIKINGVDVSTNKSFEKMAFFPDQNNFPKEFNIVDFAIYSANLKNIPIHEVMTNLELYIEALSLTEFRNSTFAELSAGMQKRALLLSTLITDPELIVLDEPTANLDIKSRLDFLKILSFLSSKFNKTIIITSHNIDELSSIINRIVIIKKIDNKGEVVYNENFDSQTQNIRDIYVEKIGGLKTNIDFEKISTIKKVSPLNDGRETILNLPILKRIFLEMIKSKIFISMTAIITVLTIVLQFIFIFLLPPLIFDLNSTIIAWIPFTLLAIYVSYFEIHYCVRFYIKEFKNGVINLEIRSGISKWKIYLERFLISKLIIFSYLIIMISILALFMTTTNNFYAVKIIKNTLPGYFFLMILDLLLFAIISLFITINSTALVGVIGAIFAIFSSTSLMMDFALTEFTYDYLTNANSHGSENMKSYNTRYLIGFELQKIMNQHGEDSYIKKHLKSLENIDEVIDLKDHDNLKTQFDYLNNSNESGIGLTRHDYIQKLMINGLITEVDSLKIYSNSTPISQISTENFKTNDLINDLKEISNYQEKKTDFDYNASLFRVYSNDEVLNKNLYKTPNGLYELIKIIKSKNKESSEIFQIASLIQNISTYAYGRYNSERQFTHSVLEPAVWSGYGNGPMWTYSKELNFNQSWNSKINISDGVRSFNKIYTDLLMNYVNLPEAIYGNTSPSGDDPNYDINASKYNGIVSTISYLSPFTTISRVIFESSYDKYFNALNYSTNWINKTYEVTNYNQNSSYNEVGYNKLFDEVKSVGVNFSPTGASFIYLTLSLILIGSGYLIYSKRIIR